MNEQDFMAELADDHAREVINEVKQGAYDTQFTCKKCGCVGADEDEVQLHWKTCPELICKDCNGTGFITVDDFNGDHVQYESKCDCQIEK